MIAKLLDYLKAVQQRAIVSHVSLPLSYTYCVVCTIKSQKSVTPPHQPNSLTFIGVIGQYSIVNDDQSLEQLSAKLYIALISHVRRLVASEGPRTEHRYPNRLVQPLRKGEGIAARSVLKLILRCIGTGLPEGSRVDKWLQFSHVLQNLAVAIVDAVLAVEAVLEDFALGVEFVDYGVGVAALVVREDGDLAELGHLEEELT